MGKSIFKNPFRNLKNPFKRKRRDFRPRYNNNNNNIILILVLIIIICVAYIAFSAQPQSTIDQGQQQISNIVPTQITADQEQINNADSLDEITSFSPFNDTYQRFVQFML
tara:strand:- start:104 stop:433 length:330 start_codon:yes stop_codon:yes gene_type:complete